MNQGICYQVFRETIEGKRERDPDEYNMIASASMAAKEFMDMKDTVAVTIEKVTREIVFLAPRN